LQVYIALAIDALAVSAALKLRSRLKAESNLENGMVREDARKGTLDTCSVLINAF
jgi:hypothetical protein